MSAVNIKLIEKNSFFIEESYKVLRTNLQFCGKDVKVITFTSCHENEGKSTTVLNLGKGFSELDKKVIVIDCDMRKSVMVSRNSDAMNVQGLSEYLSGLCQREDAIYQTQFSGFDVMFAGRVCPNPVELLSSNSFKDLISWAKENYDYVLVDTAPLGIVIDAAVIGPLTDGVALLISENVRYSQAKNIVDQLEKSGAKILGAVRNKVGKKKKSVK